ncbi:heterokaryon incompatibility protein-domain-containing protein [Dendryphion nanum]|uniref:Heterokaryon incompatibility protein-domain-containing protein n=1 Tax=Dendryphion nanum TaxID=256645 RepID=A0A9P9IEJ4_9PLEO|nr:heterokaryon incompatibility protein-domain-containing protein [Dendryphion nanum]
MDPPAWNDATKAQWGYFWRKAGINYYNFPDNNPSEPFLRLLHTGFNINQQWPNFDDNFGTDITKWQSLPGYNCSIRCGSILHAAARRGNVKLLELLLAKGADLRVKSLDGSTPLFESILVSNKEVTSALVKHGVNVKSRIFADFPYGDAVTAIQLACKMMDPETVRLLLQNGAIADLGCVEIALSNEDFNLLQVILRAGAPLDFSSAKIQTARARTKRKGQRTLHRLLSGTYSISEFINLSSKEVKNAMEESECPLGPTIKKLRMSLRGWIDRRTEEPFLSRDVLCARCVKVVSDEPVTIYDAEKISLVSCPLCRLIFDKKKHHWAELQNVSMMPFNQEKSDAGPDWRTIYDKSTLTIGWPRGELETVLLKLQDCKDTGTESEGTMALARSWLLNCITEHDKCSASMTDLPRLPTRVIDVGNDLQDPRLFVTNEKPGVYAALSYCWGKQRFIRTEISTLPLRQERIGLDELPKTLRESVLICRQLSIQYIWIDALCIVQDDADDWARESQKMAAIYRNALVTLIASSANDTTEGCFQPRDRNRIWPVKIPDVLDKNKRHQVRDHYPRIYPTTWHYSQDFWKNRPTEDPSVPQDNLYAYADYKTRVQGPIDTRAWCAQEHFMSSRILYFSNEVYWECRCCYASESHPGGTRNPIFLNAGKVREATLSTATEVFNNDELDATVTDWERVVEQYSKRQITMQSDRLIALAGMATLVGKLMGCEFLAGVWSGKQLCRSLLWQVLDLDIENDEQTKPGLRSGLQPQPQPSGSIVAVKVAPDKQLFPSWCWASCLNNWSRIAFGRWDEPKQANQEPTRTPFEVADVISTNVSNVFTKEAVRGKITLRGRLRKMRPVTGQNGDSFDSVAINFVRILPAEEDDTSVELQESEVGDEVDSGAPSSPPLKRSITFDEEVTNDTREGANNSFGTGFPPLFGNDLFSALEKLSVQQNAKEKTPVPISKRDHFWIKDNFESSHTEIWCLAIAFWEDDIIGLCLKQISNDNEFSRIGLCKFQRSGNVDWDEDVEFEAWKTAEKATVSII